MAETLDQDRGGNVVAAAVSTAIIALVIIALRVWSRVVFRKAGFWWDDWTVIAAVPFLLATLVLTLYWVHIGLGKHLKRVLVTGTKASDILLLLFVDGFLYSTGITLVKLSALLFYARVFKNITWYRRTLLAAGILAIAWWIAFVLVATFTCLPVDKQWIKAKRGHCIDPASTYIGTATPNVLIDLFILLLPMPMIWRLQASVRRRLALGVVFALGYCVMIISIVRLVTVVRFQNEGSEDLSWDFVEVHILVQVELPLAMVSVSLPSVFQLINRVSRHGLTSLFTTRDPFEHAQGTDGTQAGKPGIIMDGGNQGFKRLKTDGGNSVDRLVHNMASANGHPATSTSESDIPLEHIQIRRDIDVHPDAAGRLA